MEHESEVVGTAAQTNKASMAFICNSDVLTNDEFRNALTLELTQDTWGDASIVHPLSFVVMQYNILATKYLNKKVGNNVPAHLSWPYRFNRIANEINQYKPHLICMQEVEESMFRDLSIGLSAMGYVCRWSKRSGDALDGCAFFFLSNEFSHVSHSNLDFDCIAHQFSHKDISNAFMTHNICQVELLIHTKSEMMLLVANPHIHWNPSLHYVKLAQGNFILRHIEDEYIKRQNGLRDGINCGVLVCGDFNSTPSSALYELYSKGKVSTPSELSELGELHHDLRLRSAFACVGDPITNITKDFKACLDYIWHSPGLYTTHILKHQFHVNPLDEDTAFPDEVRPSDHVCLVARMMFAKDIDAMGDPTVVQQQQQ